MRTESVSLYIKEVRAGSIVVDLMALAPQALQLISYTNALVNFFKHIKAAYDYLSGASDVKPPLDKTTYQNLSNIVEPVAKDRGSQINIGNVSGDLVLHINSTEANAIQNAAKREIELLAEPTVGIHEKVLLYWYQARNEAKSGTGDRAIIESISPKPVKTIWADDLVKSQMVLDDENPFKEAYVVDVFVETIRGKPALYKILKLHEKFDRDSQ